MNKTKDVRIKSTDSGFEDIARKAFEVMQARRWTVYRDQRGKWFPMDAVRRCYPMVLLNWNHPGYFDPFTPLVEADKWLRETPKEQNQ